MNCNRILILIVEDWKIIFLRTPCYPLFILKIQHKEDDISVTTNKYKSWKNMREGEFYKLDDANFKVK